MKFKLTTNFIVRSGVVSFNTTAKQIKQGAGDHTAFNKALLSALTALESLQSNNIAPIGVAGTWEGINLQLYIKK